MTLHIFGYQLTELTSRQKSDFEVVREKNAPVCGAAGRDPAKLLRASLLTCQKGGYLQSAYQCLDCDRFVNFVPSRDRSFVTVRCAARSSDPVKSVMSLANSVLTIEPFASVSVADEFARTRGVRHLMVESNGSFIGLVCRCDFVGAGREDTVARHMTRRVLVVEPETSMGAAAALMAEYGVGCLPVLQGDKLRGVVTRGDLRRAGVEEEWLGARACSRCGSRRGVCVHPQRQDACELCFDCHRAAA